MRGPQQLYALQPVAAPSVFVAVFGGERREDLKDVKELLVCISSCCVLVVGIESPPPALWSYGYTHNQKRKHAYIYYKDNRTLVSATSNRRLSGLRLIPL